MRRVSVHLLLVATLICAGCASPLNPEAMIAQGHLPVHKSPSTVVVSVTGGKPTAALGASQLADEDFARALRQSIEQSGLFARALKEGSAKYLLQAWIARIHRPFLSSRTIVMEVNYTLTRTEPKQVLWQKAVSSTYTALVGEAFGAARENIEQAIQEISQLRLE